MSINYRWLNLVMAMDFNEHYSKYGKGKSRKQHRRTHDAYVKKALAMQDEVADEIDDNMSWVNPDQPMNHEVTGDGKKATHLLFRQLDNKGNAQQYKPIYRSKTGRNLMGTSGKNLVQDLISEDIE